MVTPLRTIFFGNSRYSVIDVQKIHNVFGLSAVVTIPDRTTARKELLVSPVKLFAIEKSIPVIEASKLTPDVVEKIRAYNPDFLIVADYGLILPQSLLSLPRYAALNVHHSLLPKYRGPSPAPSAILAGEQISGVSIISMTKKVDAGDILKQVSYTLKPDETSESLLTELNILGAQAVTEVMEMYVNGTTRPQQQNESQATFTTYMSKKDGLLNLNDSPEMNWRKIRAYHEWPGTYFTINKKGKEMRVIVATATYSEGILKIERVIPEGKKEMSWKEFEKNYSANK